jgi:hypothetical protein
MEWFREDAAPDGFKYLGFLQAGLFYDLWKT